MENYSLSDSVLLNRNFRLKIGRTLYGYTGACHLLGEKRVNALLSKALRCPNDVFRFKSQSLNLMVCFYAK